MHRDPIRRILAWGAAATLLLPVVLAVVLGLGGLLGGLGDAAGSRACLRIGLVVGVVWVTAIVATTAAGAVAHLERPPCPCERPRRRRRRRWPPLDDRRRLPIESSPPDRSLDRPPSP